MLTATFLRDQESARTMGVLDVDGCIERMFYYGGQ